MNIQILFLHFTQNSFSVMSDPIEWLKIFATVLSVITTLVGAFIACKKIWKKHVMPYKNYSQFIDEVYSKETRETITRYYIQTRGQDIDPCEQEEIRDDNGKFLSENLINFFINIAFREESNGKYFLVLADSGMGKTTFLLRLYRECLFNRSIKRKHRKKKVEFVPLATSKCLETIKSIVEPENTILLLDGMDENVPAIKNYEKFFMELVDATEKFYRIVITCRTQFFPNRAAEPDATGRIKIGTGNKAEEIIKKYLSPFSDDDIREYLRKKYRFNKKKQKSAYEIVHKVPVLMARPIILNWIDYLCDSRIRYEYSYQIYQTIIEQWIKRESLQQDNRLFDLSMAISEYMLEHETTSMPAEIVESIAKRNDIQILPIIAKSRSLLNRNGRGEFKFAHRSFLEYFIVYNIFDKLVIPKNTRFLFSLSGVKRFLFEKLLNYAEITDKKSINNAGQVLHDLQQYIHEGNLLDFLQKNNLSFRTTNTHNGFLVEARIFPNTSDAFNQNSVRFLDSSLYVLQIDDGSATIKKSKVFELALSFFVTKDIGSSIKTTLDIKVNADSDIRNDKQVLLRWKNDIGIYT